MLDQIIAVAVVLLPTLFAVGIEVVSKEIKEHPYWRIAVVAFGIGLSALTWFQMSRAAKIAAADRQTAIVETSKQVSAAVSESVTKAVTQQYQNMVADQKKQIGDLQGQLAAQGKKVDAISDSNIVTGKKPVKVEVVNPNAPSALPQVQDLKVVSVRDIPSTYPDAPFGIEVAIQTTVPLQPVLLNIECAEPLLYVDWAPAAGFTGLQDGAGYPSPQTPRVAIVNMVSPAFSPQHAMIVKIFSVSKNRVLGLKYKASNP